MKESKLLCMTELKIPIIFYVGYYYVKQLHIPIPVAFFWTVCDCVK